jgi:large conductance mechanosensitive channel
MKGFRAFLLRGNVVDLAVGIIIGVAFGTVIQAFVKDLVTPLIAALVGKPDFGALSFTINRSRFAYGDFLNAAVAFVLIAAVVYWLVVLPYSNLMIRFTPAPEPVPATTTCPECLSKIPAGARRCAACGEVQPA